VLVVANPDFKCTANDVKKFLAFVGVGFAAAAAGLDAKEVRLHCFIAPGEKLHANAFGSFQDASLVGGNEARIILGVVEERKKVRAVVTRDASERGDRGAHLAAFQGAEKTDRHAGGTSDLDERKFALLPEAAKALAGRQNTFRGDGDNALTFQNVNYGGGI
jgi:hypothetical protein